MKIKKKKFGGTIKLMPIGKDGKEVDWFHGWPGVIKYTEALGKSWVDVGQLIEETWGDRVSAAQIWLCQEVHKSLQKIDYYRRPRLKMAPRGEEPDLHYAIRMNYTKIKKSYAACGKAKDMYKAVSQLYNSVMKSNRKKWVLAYLDENKLSAAQRKKTAKAMAKALNHDIIGKVLKDIKLK
tara:strand:+ start:308 stop:850 length:543 start_codon:yes stop_codon:yes gene_type:complete